MPSITYMITISTRKGEKRLVLFLILTMVVFTLIALPGLLKWFSQCREPCCTEFDRVVVFKLGTYDSGGNWDPAISDGNNILNKYYSYNCLETLFYFHENSPNPRPNLAVSCEYEYWSEEVNSKGFINRGGIKALNITLREGVLFHDNSNWNATVAKWNIDRLFVITGNLTGKANYTDRSNEYYFWKDVESVKPYFTASWNLSEYDANWINYSANQYSYYIIGENTTLSNPIPYGGWDPIKGKPIHYSPYDKFPIIRQVKILKDKLSGGMIRVEFNDWNSNGFDALLFPQISMVTYKEYFDRGIYGYENGALDSRNPSAVTHMVGTGPYIYFEQDDTGIPPGGILVRNSNYWNRSSLIENNLFEVDRIEAISFPSNELGQDARSTAMLTHALDYTIDEGHYLPLDYGAIQATPIIAYIEWGVSNYITQITLNCINETWWSWGSPYDYKDNISSIHSDQGKPRGIPRALRKAISFAFEYDTYISSTLDQRAERAGGMLGLENLYFNSSVPLARYNLTKAREILLKTEDDPYTYNYTQEYYNFSKLCSTRGLSFNSTDIEWQNVADTNPLLILDFYWDDTHDELMNIFQISLRNIGIALNAIGETNGIPDQLSPCFNTFDGSTSIWSSHSWSWENKVPATFSDLLTTLSYQDPNKGSWRDQPWGPSTDPSFTWNPDRNYAFCYDTDIDSWLDRIQFSNSTGKLKWYRKIAFKVQNELYPNIYITQGKKALALWKEWEFDLNRGLLFFANLNYLGCPQPLCRQTVPGYDSLILISFVGISMVILTVKKTK
ncbi:MAG: ABC transporter substrate-binding protein [Promethearchaeota archaeon]